MGSSSEYSGWCFYTERRWWVSRSWKWEVSGYRISLQAVDDIPNVREKVQRKTSAVTFSRQELCHCIKEYSRGKEPPLCQMTQRLRLCLTTPPERISRELSLPKRRWVARGPDWDIRINIYLKSKSEVCCCMGVATFRNAFKSTIVLRRIRRSKRIKWGAHILSDGTRSSEEWFAAMKSREGHGTRKFFIIFRIPLTIREWTDAIQGECGG